MKRTREIYDVFMRAVKEGSIPFGYYGPETCRWATPDEMRRFGLKDCPMVHLDESGEIDCYFTETGATVVPGRHIKTLRREAALSRNRVRKNPFLLHAPRPRQVDSPGICILYDSPKKVHYPVGCSRDGGENADGAEAAVGRAKQHLSESTDTKAEC